MILLVKKKSLYRAAMAATAGVMAVALVYTALGAQSALPASKTSGLADEKRTFILDPGHGGEDGGAVSGDGTSESNLNLRIAEKLYFLFRFCGQSCGMTRNSDVSVYSSGSDTLHEKKVSDLKNRVSMVNQTSCAFLISIHQNFLPSSSVHGAQVFYNTQSSAKETGLQIQNCLNETVNGARKKAAKPISPTIYLMKNIQKPGVLIECGFLSNPAETEKLKSPAYQTLLAASIVSGTLRI